METCDGRGDRRHGELHGVVIHEEGDCPACETIVERDEALVKVDELGVECDEIREERDDALGQVETLQDAEREAVDALTAREQEEPPPLTWDSVARVAERLKALVPDFAESVAPIYAALGWIWADGERNVVPDAARIRRTLDMVIDSLGERARVDPRARLTKSWGGIRVSFTSHGGGIVDARMALERLYVCCSFTPGGGA